MSESDFRSWIAQRYPGCDIKRTRFGQHVITDRGTEVRVIETPGLGDAARGEVVRGLVHTSQSKSQRAEALRDYQRGKAKAERSRKLDVSKEAAHALKLRQGSHLGLTKRGRILPHVDPLVAAGVKGVLVYPHMNQGS